MPRRKARIMVKPTQPQAYPPSSSPLELLPLEVKLRVVSHISSKDAGNLALVSRSLQDAAESIVWSKVDMSLPAEWDNQITLWEESMPSWWEVKTLTPKIEGILTGFKSSMDIEGGSIKPWSQDDGDICWNIRTFKILTRLKQVMKALESRPIRIKWITKFCLELPVTEKREVCEKLKGVTSIIGKNLRVIRIGPPDINLRSSKVENSRYDLIALIRSTGLNAEHLPKLHTFEIDLAETLDLETQLSEIIQSVGPNLQNLILRNIKNPPSSPFKTIPTDKDSRSKPIPKFPSLKSLQVNHLHPNSIQLICKLIASAENLETLRIDFIDERLAWEKQSEKLTEGEIKILREHKGLKRIEWYGGLGARWWFERISESGFENVELLVQSQAVECESETYIENILIPPFPSLRAILVSCRTTKWYRHLAPPDWAKAPPPRNSISPHVISHLQSASSLLAVQFGCLSELTIEDILNISQWCDKRVNGVLIRSYSNQATGEEFYHLRRLELLSVQPKLYNKSTYKEWYDTMKECHPNEDERELDHNWIDHTSFKNATLPPPILKKIYKSIGEKGDWSKPGRGLELPESTWEILRSWRMKLPDKGLEKTKIVTRRMARDLQ